MIVLLDIFPVQDFPTLITISMLPRLGVQIMHIHIIQRLDHNRSSAEESVIQLRVPLFIQQQPPKITVPTKHKKWNREQNIFIQKVSNKKRIPKIAPAPMDQQQITEHLEFTDPVV